MDSGDTKVLDVSVSHPQGFDFLTHLPPPSSASSIGSDENDDITNAHYSLFFVDAEMEGVYKKWFDHNMNPVGEIIPVRTNQIAPKQIRAYPRYEGKNTFLIEIFDQNRILSIVCSVECLLLLWIVL